jgi:hypothetical protein
MEQFLKEVAAATAAALGYIFFSGYKTIVP